MFLGYSNNGPPLNYLNNTECDVHFKLASTKAIFSIKNHYKESSTDYGRKRQFLKTSKQHARSE